MGRLRKSTIDTHIEKRIVTGAIVSSEFLKRIIPNIDFRYFQIDYSKQIMKWVLAHYERYQKAPGNDIQEIFLSEKHKLNGGEEEVIKTFLTSLSADYIEEGFSNTPYLVGQATDYFRKRALEVTIQDIKDLTESGHIDLAEEKIFNYKRVKHVLSEWVSIFDVGMAERIYDEKLMAIADEDKGGFLFKFPGRLGHLFGPFFREWLVAFMGPMKRGKTFFLQECAIQALIERKNVAFISLEMSTDGMADRFFSRVSPMTKRDDKADNIYPCFDCALNQKDICVKPERVNRIPLLDDKNNKPTFVPKMKYRSCVVCRGIGTEYKPATWYEVLPREEINRKRHVLNIKNFTNIGGKGLRFLSYPAYSANISMVKNGLDNLEFEGFVPDVIIIDYADILAPESKKNDYRTQIDETWKTLKNLAASRKCMVITASQTTRKTLGKGVIRPEDTAEDIRKLAHVDAMYALNQTDLEKTEGVIKLSTVVHRHKEYDVNKQVMVLQNLKMGQPVLDSEYFYKLKEQKKEQK